MKLNSGRTWIIRMQKAFKLQQLLWRKTRQKLTSRVVVWDLVLKFKRVLGFQVFQKQKLKKSVWKITTKTTKATTVFYLMKVLICRTWVVAWSWPILVQSSTKQSATKNKTHFNLTMNNYLSWHLQKIT